MNHVSQRESSKHCIELNFDDFDLFEETIRHWDLDFIKLDSTSFKAHMRQILGSRINLVEVRFNSKFDQHGEPPPGMRSIAIPADPAQHIYWRGQEIFGNRIGVWPIGGELEAVSQPGFHVYVLSLPDKLFGKIGWRMGYPNLQELLKNEEYFELSSRAMAILRHSLYSFISDALANPEIINTEDSENVAVHELVETLIKSIVLDRVQIKPEHVRFREQALRRAIEYINSNAQIAPRISDVYRAAFASERTLQYAFLERFGMTTKSYLESVRLNRARKDLNRLNPDETTVKAIATKWGYWHMGKFGRDYYNLFNELPSETLKKKKYSIL